MQASAERRAPPDEVTFLDWLRHYGALMALFLIAGTMAGLTAAALSRGVEVSTLVVSQGGSVPLREFGVVGGAVFRSDATLRPAMQKLGISTSTQEFLADDVELRPVPDARMLIVIGRASTADRAREISARTAGALRSALADAGLEGLTRLRGEITRRSLSPKVLVGLGAFSGAWLGIGAAIVLYRLHRPVLSLNRVFDLIAPQPVAILEGRASWLGALRRPRWLWRGGRNDQALSRLAVQEPILSVVVPGEDGQRRRPITERLTRELRRRGASVGPSDDTSSDRAPDVHADRSNDVERTTLLVAEARTQERELTLEMAESGRGDVRLLWIL
jgi:hypothetical protein